MISHIDHFVLTVRSLDATCRFYERVLGFMCVDIEGLPTALTFGHQKINLHQADRTFEPKAAKPTMGSGDFCLIADRPLSQLRAHLEAEGIAIELGPVKRTGAQGLMTSLYFRDPDGNLIEVSEYDR